MRLVFQLAHRRARRLRDLERGRSEVAPAQIRVLASLPPDEIHPALNRVNGEGEPILRDEAAKVVAEKVTGGVVDMEAVGHAGAVERKGCAVDGEGWGRERC